MPRWTVDHDPARRLYHLQQALHSLKDAIESTRLAQAPYALMKLRRAKASLEGAIRHAQGRAIVSRNPTAHRAYTRTVTRAKRPRRLNQGEPSPTPYLDDFRAHVRKSYQEGGTVFTYTRDLQERAEKEGWGIFNDAEIQRLDDDDAGRGYILKNDRAATRLAKLAGVPVDRNGYLTCDRLVWDPGFKPTKAVRVRKG